MISISVKPKVARKEFVVEFNAGVYYNDASSVLYKLNVASKLGPMTKEEAQKHLNSITHSHLIFNSKQVVTAISKGNKIVCHDVWPDGRTLKI